MNDWNEPDFDEPHQDDHRVGQVRYIGEDKAMVELHRDYSSMTRSNNYPFDEEIDYDPRVDEDRSEHDER
jgi:hypothetical protein